MAECGTPMSAGRGVARDAFGKQPKGARALSCGVTRTREERRVAYRSSKKTVAGLRLDPFYVFLFYHFLVLVILNCVLF